MCSPCARGGFAWDPHLRSARPGRPGRSLLGPSQPARSPPFTPGNLSCAGQHTPGRGYRGRRANDACAWAVRRGFASGSPQRDLHPQPPHNGRLRLRTPPVLRDCCGTATGSCWRTEGRARITRRRSRALVEAMRRANAHARRSGQPATSGLPDDLRRRGAPTERGEVPARSMRAHRGGLYSLLGTRRLWREATVSTTPPTRLGLGPGPGLGPGLGPERPLARLLIYI